MSRRDAQPALKNAEQMGFGHSPTSILNLDFEKSDSKIASWYQLALLAGTAYRKTPVSIFTSDSAEEHLPGIIQAKECMKKKKHISEEQHYLCEIGLEKMPYGSSWLYKSYTEESLTHITITAAPCKVPALP